MPLFRDRWSSPRSRYVAALVTGTLAAAVLTGAEPAAGGTVSQASTVTWRVVYSVKTGIVDLHSITAASRSDAWAVGTIKYQQNGPENVLVLHWDGSAWRRVAVPHPAGFIPWTVASASTSNVWIFGDDGASGPMALWFNGSTWQSTAPPSAVGGFGTGIFWDPTSPVVVSGPNVWADGFWTVTNPGYPNGANFIWNLNGHQWTYTRLVAALTGCGAITAAGSHVWLLAAPNAAIASCGTHPFQPELYASAGGTWQRVTNPENQISSLSWLAATPQGGLWLLARPARPSTDPWHLDYWNGVGWARRALPTSWDAVILPGSQLLPDGHGGVWIGEYAHWTGMHWVLPAQCSCNLMAMAVVPGSASAWSLGTPGYTPHASHILVYGPLP